MTAPATVARTMSEKGELCPDCTHPWGRHNVQQGCVARSRDSRRTQPPCSCSARPARRGGAPADEHGPAVAVSE